MSALFLILGIAFILSLLPIAFLVARAYVKARGPRVIVCPETTSPEVVEVDAAQAAWTGVTEQPAYRLVSCSRWPERQDCDQRCLAQIESAPDGCLVRERLAKWYEGASCAICFRPFGEIQWFSHRPALLGPDRKIRAWEEVPAEELPEVLGTHYPLCWDCQMIVTFRTRFPDRVIDDPRPPYPRSPGGRTGSAA
jgi:hypothetical protein